MRIKSLKVIAPVLISTVLSGCTLVNNGTTTKTADVVCYFDQTSLSVEIDYILYECDKAPLIETKTTTGVTYSLPAGYTLYNDADGNKIGIKETSSCKCLVKTPKLR